VRALAVLAVAAVAGVAAASRARADAGVADRTTVQLSGGALVAPAAPLVELSVARFVGELVEIGVRQEGGFATGPGPHDWHLATTPFLDVHLLPDPKPRLTPFLGVAAGAVYDDRAAAATVGPEAGVRLRIGEHAFVAARYQFRWASQPVGGLGRDEHLLFFGVGFLLGQDSAAELARAEASAARAEEAAAKAEEAVARLERAVTRLERAVDEFAVWFEEQLRK
jgi:hypothetical protein